MISLYNSLTRKKERLIPINAGSISMYVCGVTVYDYCHLGHARTFTVFDTLVRFLKSQGLNVNYVRNITDIDDKIIAAARAGNCSISDISGKYAMAMHEDFAGLGLLPPTHEPRATDHIVEIIEFIKKLLDDGYAYIAPNHDVIFHVPTYKDYGRLSGQILANLRNNELVSAHKKHGADFALWKAATSSKEPSWDSPWGRGRPGWHIECSAMSLNTLGAYFDIHGGGSDLLFPHHENELTQSVCANKSNYANIWMHSGMVTVDNDKMSKSLDNFITIKELLGLYSAETIRFFLLNTHYRSPLVFSHKRLAVAHSSLCTLYLALRNVRVEAGQEVLIGGNNTAGHIDARVAKFSSAFYGALCDDFNTPAAISVLFEVAHAVNVARRRHERPLAHCLAQLLITLGTTLNILQGDSTTFVQHSDKEQLTISKDEIHSLIAQRAIFRQQKEWHAADAIRAQLAQHGIELEDQGEERTLWRTKW